MKRSRKLIIIIVIVLLALAVAFAAVFFLIKSKKVLFNQIFISDEDVVGVDVSKYQMDIDMDELARQNIDFVYIKATEGSTNTDENFSVNWKNAGNSLLARGAYHFFSFDSDGDTQAQNYIKTVGSLTGDLRPVIDVEYYGDKEQNPPAREDVIRELHVMLDELEKEYGVKPVIYASGTLYDTYIKGEFDEYPRWVRSVYYHVNIDNGDNWLVWQYCDRGRLSGYSGGEKYIDLNVLNRKNSLQDLLVP